jgi:uncharacterized protein YceH (UPF0502 family)
MSVSDVAAEFTVVTGELRSASVRLAEFEDALDDVRRRGIMDRASRWGSVEALDAGGRFRDRFHHLLAGLAAEADDARHHLRQTADAYEMADESASTSLRHLGAAL